MLNTDSVRMCANMPPGIFNSNRAETRDSHRSSDYFASSTDFEYDLFLRGIVSCDPSTAVVYRSGTTSATTNRKSLNSGFLSRVTQRSSQRKKCQNPSSIFSSVTSLNRVAFDPFVPRPPRADSYDHFDSSQSIQFCDFPFSLRHDDDEYGFKKSSSFFHHQNRNSLQATVIEEELESPPSGQNLSHQQQHALHRFRRQKKKGIISKLRDAVISFTPQSRPSIIGRSDLFYRYGKAEQESLACFSFLDEELKNCCATTTYPASTGANSPDESFINLVDFELSSEACCDTNQTIPDSPCRKQAFNNIVIEQQQPSQTIQQQPYSDDYAEDTFLKDSKTNFPRPDGVVSKNMLTVEDSQNVGETENGTSSDCVCVTECSTTQTNNQAPPLSENTANNSSATNNTNNSTTHQNRPSGSNKQKKKSKQKCKNNKHRK